MPVTKVSFSRSEFAKALNGKYLKKYYPSIWEKSDAPLDDRSWIYL
jgi:hypothetical protein